VETLGLAEQVVVIRLDLVEEEDTCVSLAGTISTKSLRS